MGMGMFRRRMATAARLIVAVLIASGVVVTFSPRARASEQGGRLSVDEFVGADTPPASSSCSPGSCSASVCRSRPWKMSMVRPLRTTRAAIDRGLNYLARKQDRDGSWTNTTRSGEYPVAMTALAGLALLMDGNTTTQGRYAPQVDRAVRFLLRSQLANGLITQEGQEGRPMYGHGFSMLFLSQVYGMTEDPDRSRQIHDVLVRAVELTARAQSNGGWYYTHDARNDEGSVTITQVQALRACRNAGIAVPKDVIDNAMAYLEKSQNRDGGIRYSLRRRMGASRPPLTAAAVCCWYNAGLYDSPLAARAIRYCKAHLSAGSASSGHDYYAHLYFAQALFVSDDPFWEEYYPQRRDYLLRLQRSDGFWLGDAAGDVYGTAVALIILQLPYNQVPIMQQ